MRIGLASLFSFRPHVENLAYLSKLLARDGNEIIGFDCVSGVDSCYPRNLREKNRLVECGKCLIGGVRSYGIPISGRVDKRYAKRMQSDRLCHLTLSSIATVLRTESSADLYASEFRERQERLYASIELVYGSALRWLEKEQVEAVVLFNGRMDLTAGLLAACEDADVPFVTVERSWFGHGLHLIPNGNCLSIKPISLLCRNYIGSPLLSEQAALAGRLAAERYLRANKLEWRLYNKDESRASWPGRNAGTRILVLPSSRNEFEGHPERMCLWRDYTEAMQRVIEEIGVKSEDVVLRCHPNWAERIGRRLGVKSEVHYTEWAVNNGYQVIPSSDDRSTYDLIDQCDIVIVNGSSAGVEAGIRGKQIISVGHCTYEKAGFSIQIHKDDDFGNLSEINSLSSEEIVRKTLRYIYIHARRFPQYVDFVRAESTTHYRYFDGADPKRLIEIFSSGLLSADDARAASNSNAEDEVVKKVLNSEWKNLISYHDSGAQTKEIFILRRRGLRWLDSFRDLMPRGDL